MMMKPLELIPNGTAKKYLDFPPIKVNSAALSSKVETDPSVAGKHFATVVDMDWLWIPGSTHFLLGPVALCGACANVI